MIMKSKVIVFFVSLNLLSITLLLGQGVDWSKVEPVDTSNLESQTPVRFTITDTFLSTPEIMRRDPSDIILHENKYHVWYTKIDNLPEFKARNNDREVPPVYPEGCWGTIWYATSPDGHQWTEQGVAIDKGAEDSWDGNGVITPNILVYKGKFYLAYTAIKCPYTRYSRWTMGRRPARALHHVGSRPHPRRHHLR